MANQLAALLDIWHRDRFTRKWVLGTIYKTSGPCYRKAGAMMLFDDLGKHYGLLSGGCLEADIQRNAFQALQSGYAKTLCYDGGDEDDFSFQLGIGCGGTVHILLQPVLENNQYLRLEELRQYLLNRQACIYRQKIPAVTDSAFRDLTPLVELSIAPVSNDSPGKSEISIAQFDGEWLQSVIYPVPHILLMGAGADARPMAQMLKIQGWQVSVCDPRPANARDAYFPGCTSYHCHPHELAGQLNLCDIDGAIVMGHNLELDAAAIEVLHNLPLKYLGLLGPVSRRDKVLRNAGLTLEQVNAGLVNALRAPIGLDLGGELPESIALATCAELHAVLHQGSGKCLSNNMSTVQEVKPAEIYLA